MNIPNILFLAEKLENWREAPLGFSMTTWWHDRPTASSPSLDFAGNPCNTAACSAGWARFLFPEESDGITTRYFAQDVLDLSTTQTQHLFVPDYLPAGIEFVQISPTQAAKVLRHLAETGLVCWSVALEPKS